MRHGGHATRGEQAKFSTIPSCRVSMHAHAHVLLSFFCLWSKLETPRSLVPLSLLITTTVDQLPYSTVFQQKNWTQSDQVNRELIEKYGKAKRLVSMHLTYLRPANYCDDWNVSSDISHIFLWLANSVKSMTCLILSKFLFKHFHCRKIYWISFLLNLFSWDVA